MDGSRHIVRNAGRVLALLAALFVALLPTLPAHAHMHDSHVQTGTTHAAIDAASEPDDADHRATQTADCCLLSHVPVIPAVSSVPLPTASRLLAVRAPDGTAPAEAAAERLPEPPRPFA